MGQSDPYALLLLAVAFLQTEDVSFSLFLLFEGAHLDPLALDLHQRKGGMLAQRGLDAFGKNGRVEGFCRFDVGQFSLVGG